MDELLPLLRTCQPRVDESFIGYLTRLCEVNCYEHTGLLRKVLLPGSRSGALLHFCFVSDLTAQLPGLAALTSVKPTRLDRLAYKTSELHPGKLLFFGQPVRKRSISPEQVKVCPECLKENLYVRRIWDFSLVTACPIHRRLMLDECPRCHQCIPALRSRIAICACNYDWREVPAIPLTEDELLLGKRIYSLCRLLPAAPSVAQRETVNPLKEASLESLTAAVLFIADQLAGTSNLQRGIRRQVWSNASLHPLLTQAYAVFEHWPLSYHRFLDQQAWKDESQRRDRRQRVSLVEVFGSFYTGLNQQMKRESFDFMHSEFREYLFRKWGNEMPENEDHTGQPPHLHIPMGEANRLLGTHHLLLRRFAREGRFTVSKRQGDGSVTFVELAALAKLQREVGQCVGVVEMARRLGVRVDAVLALARSRVILPLSGLRVADEAGLSFHATEADVMLRRIHEGIESSPIVSASESISFEQAYKRLRPRGISVVSFIRAVICRRLKPCGINGGNGLRGCTFTEQAITDYIKRRRHGREPKNVGPQLHRR